MGFEGINVGEAQKWLLVSWFVVAGPLILAALPIAALEPLRKLLWPVLRRGKLLRSHEYAREGLLKFTVPQSFFTHFYILGLAWNTALLFLALSFALICPRPVSVQQAPSSIAPLWTETGGSSLFGSSSVSDLGKYGSKAWRLAFLLLLLEIHLTRRLYECLFISSFDPSARVNLLGYFIALGFYIEVPLTLFLQSFQDDGFVHAFKGFLTQKFDGKPVPLTDDVPSCKDVVFFISSIGWMFYAGAALFIYGSVHQHSCHEILASIRRDEKSKYGIPRGDWFELVSSAHYLAEIVIYAGFLVASGGTHPAMWMLFMGVVANLYLLAKPTHEWYVSKFDSYPKMRQALFPRIG